jgi:hypothetical protein
MGRALDWVIPASIVVAIEYAVALSIGAAVGFHYELPTKTYVIASTTIASLILTAALLLHLGKYFREGEENPISRLLSDMSNGRARIFGILIGFILIGLQNGALTWLKVMLPITQGFWADLPLAEADRILFGKDPWIISHDLFGPITGLLDRIYVTWAPVKFVTVVGVALAAASPKKSRAMLAYFLTISTCCLMQFALPSAGPVFYAQLGLGDQFIAMPIEPWVASARDYLWADYLAGGGMPGGGISAMPSVHVAMTLWVALVVRIYFPRVQFLAWIYFAAILIGSVHLGWHYAVDGIASIAIALIGWAAAPALLVKTGQPGRKPCTST